MLIINLKIAFSNFFKNKFYSAIIIVGQIIAISSTILLFSYISYESSYDKHFKNYNRIFRIIRHCEYKENSYTSDRANTGASLRPMIEGQYPGVLEITRLSQNGGPIAYGDKKFIEPNVFFADANFFKVFNTKFIDESSRSPLSYPMTVVITKRTSDKYFGNKDAIGEIIYYKGLSFVVTGVIENIPLNTHFNFDFLFSMLSLPKVFDNPDYFKHNWDSRTWSYVLLKNNAKKENIEKLLLQTGKNIPLFDEGLFSSVTLSLQNIADIHLYSNCGVEISHSNVFSSIVFFAVLCFIIILVAGLNFATLFTASSFSRIKEMGVKKILGALNIHIAKQMFFESVLLSLMATPIAVIVAQFSLPYVNSYLGSPYTLLGMGYLSFALLILGIPFFIGIISAIYPAIHFSPISSISLFNGKLPNGVAGKNVITIFIILQLTVSMALAIATYFYFEEVLYLDKYDLKFKPDNIISISLPEYNSYYMKKYFLFRNEIQKNPQVSSIFSSSIKPGVTEETNIFLHHGNSEKQLIGFIRVDEGFFQALGIRLISGREITPKAKDEFMINSLALNTIGNDSLNESIRLTGIKDGKEIELFNGKIVGIIDNFQYKSVLKKIRPVIFVYGTDKYIFLKFKSEITPSLINKIESTWNSFFPQTAFSYTLFKNEVRSQLSGGYNYAYSLLVYSIIAFIIIIIGIIGIFGILIEKKKKEIYIRKILGASSKQTFNLFSKYLIKLVLFSTIFALPVSYYFVDLVYTNVSYSPNLIYYKFLIIPFIVLSIGLVLLYLNIQKIFYSTDVSILQSE